VRASQRALVAAEAGKPLPRFRSLNALIGSALTFRTLASGVPAGATSTCQPRALHQDDPK
jgi:hypothetical protein